MKRFPIAACFSLLTLGSLSVAEDSVTFSAQPTQVGDRVEQQVGVEMRLKNRARRGAEVLEESETSMVRAQHRVVTATETELERVVAALVEFVDASTVHNGEPSSELVVGKSYLCRREGDDLKITTDQGSLPPLEEYTVVARAMQTLGTPSPLAKYLKGRRVVVGERIALPSQVAREALGFDDGLGEVERFELELIGVETRGQRSVARFDAEIDAVGAGSGQMRMLIQGPIEIEAESCRVLLADLSGPIALMQSRGGITGGYQVDSSGRLTLKTAARRLSPAK